MPKKKVSKTKPAKGKVVEEVELDVDVYKLLVKEAKKRGKSMEDTVHDILVEIFEDMKK